MSVEIFDCRKCGAEPGVSEMYACYDCEGQFCATHSVVCLECDRVYCTDCLSDDEDCECEEEYEVDDKV